MSKQSKTTIPENVGRVVNAATGATVRVDCNQCARKGEINGLSQETYCSGCIHSDKWKKDYFIAKDVS